MKLGQIEVVGANLLLRTDVENVMFYQTTTGRWAPSRQLPEPVTPEPPVTPPDSGPTLPSGTWTHPLPGGRLTSGYGFRQGYDQPGLIHAGVDLSSTTAVVGGWVVAPCDLEITQAIENGGGGFADAGSFVKGITTSGEAYTFSFFHMAAGSLVVKKGDRVNAGTNLGREGQTGYAFGTHLHLEMWPGHITSGFRFDSPWYYGDGTPINPQPVFAANGVNL